MDERRANERVASVGVFPAILTEAECRRVVLDSSAWPEEPVGIGPEPSEPIRRATTRFVTRAADTEWLFSRITGVFLAANNTFGFAIDGAIERILFVTYGLNGFLGWHTDLGDGEECTRKLSMSILLNGPDTHTGGGLQMVSMEEALEERSAGSAIVFPAHLAHRVLPVTSGRRDVLVAWMHGPSFR